ncbi:MAG: 2-dehydropantoate 2-reductase [Acidimicrobiia bacterium]|jgi:2-dehydropantoate 2-reductase|nr:2-dehydropantoate 2-reductase [Acidimicrobiia bacterium]
MKIAVVGCGAMGSVYAGLLASAGHEVWAVDTWSEHMAAIRERGLRVAGASGDRTVRLAGAVAKPDEVGQPMDLVILATKAPQVEQAADALAVLLGPDTPVISIQNGLGSPQKVADRLGPERVVIGVVGGFGASVPEPGHAHHNGMEFVRLGELAGQGVSERVRRLGEVWESGGFKVLIFDNVHQLVWEKLICNATFSGPCAITGLRVGEVIDDPEAWSVASGCATEAWQVAKAKGIPVDIDEPVSYVRNFGLKIPNAQPSMLLDHLAGRPSEVDVINGAIPPAAAEVGLSAPINATVTALIKVKERTL